MKLLFVNSSLTGGGSEKALLLVAQALLNRGHDVTMVLLREKPRTYQLDSRIKIIEFKYRSRGKLGILLERVRRLRSVMRFEKFDYTICYMWDLNVVTLISSLGFKSRTIVSERAFPGASSRNRLSRLIERIVYKLAYRIVYQTSGARDFCPPELSGKSIIVPNIIELQKRDTPWSPKEHRIVSAGRLGIQKNFALLLESFALFSSEFPDWTLEIYGQGPLEDSLRLKASELKLTSKVAFPGYIDNLADRIQSAGMFVLSSDFEGISNAMTESMSLGVPTICTDCPVGGASLLIENGVSGVLVPVGDRDNLAAAMKRVASDPIFAASIAEGASKSVLRFTPDRMADVWEQEVLV